MFLIDVCCFCRRGEIVLDLFKGYSKWFLFMFVGMLVIFKKWIFVYVLKNYWKKNKFISNILYVYIFIKIGFSKEFIIFVFFFLLNLIKLGFWFIYYIKGVMVLRCVVLIIIYLLFSKC